MDVFNPLNAELNPICHLLALLGAHHIYRVSGIRVELFLHSLYIYSVECDVVSFIECSSELFMTTAITNLHLYWCLKKDKTNSLLI